MEPSPPTRAAPKSKRSGKNKNKNKSKAVSELRDEDPNRDASDTVEDHVGEESAATTAVTNGNNTIDDVTSHDNEHQGEVIELLREELKRERERTRELQTKLDTLSTSADNAEKEVLKFREERSRADGLENEVQSLKTALEKASGNGTRAVELQALRRNLEEEREGREKVRSEHEKRLAEMQEQKDKVDAQYQSLLGRVSTIRATLGERMKADAEELAQTKQAVVELEEQNRFLDDTLNELQDAMRTSNSEKDSTLLELSNLRRRLNLAQDNWVREREDLVEAEHLVKKEYEAARQAMQDWEVIAMEERSVRESLSDHVVGLEEQLTALKISYDQVTTDHDKQSSVIDGLQRALQELQDARRKELREIVENTQSQIDALAINCQELEKHAREAESNLADAKQDLERILPFEKEVKEKNLLIGKLRHEAVTLNDHLRKALRMLKRDNADDKIDKQLVTNVFLQFVSIQRGDAKKYEVLQLIASVLDWNDEQREKAGLLRPGTAANMSSGLFMSNLKTPPLSPFHRSPSTPQLNDAYGGDKDIWATVLDSEK